LIKSVSIISTSSYDEKSLCNKNLHVTEIKTRGPTFFGILETSDGNIWFGAFDGVHRYDGNTVIDFKDKQDDK